MAAVVSLAFYKFVRIANPEQVADAFRTFCGEIGIKGTLIFAHEGLNGSLAGSPEAAEAFVNFCKNNDRFAAIDFKLSHSNVQPFRRMLVKIKPEIVTMGKENINPEHFSGKYVRPLELQNWLQSGVDLLLVDTRNDYEVRLGTFENAIDPQIKTFRTFPDWVEKNLAGKKEARIVTFCTGGIRCEKATAYMRQQGFEDVYQLEGGILKYFEETQKNAALSHPDDEVVLDSNSCSASTATAAPFTTQLRTHYRGDCFVFDYRVAVDQNLQKTSHEICFACWQPLTPEERNSPLYEFEISCPHCATSQQKKAAALRQKQMANNQRALLRRQERSAKAKEQRKQLSQNRSRPPETAAPSNPNAGT